MKVVSEKVTVLNKNTKDVEKNGSSNTYFNISVGGMGFSHTLGVPKEVFDNVEVGDEIHLEGQVGFSRPRDGKAGERFWYFDKLYSGK